MHYSVLFLGRVLLSIIVITRRLIMVHHLIGLALIVAIMTLVEYRFQTTMQALYVKLITFITTVQTFMFTHSRGVEALYLVNRKWPLFFVFLPP